MVAEKLEDIINKNDKELMEMVNYIKRNNRQGFYSRSKFKTFTFETSRGKTTGTAYAMCQSIFDGNKTKYIFTTKKTDECFEVANMIIEECKDTFTELEDEPIVMVYTPGKEDTAISSEDFYKCAKAKILIITHSTYLNLCKPKTKFHEGYAENVKRYFNTLVIDEEINAIVENLCIYNQFIYESTLKLIKATNNKDTLGFYECLCDVLKEIIGEYKKNDSYKNRIVVAEKDTVNIFPQMMYEELIQSIRSIDEEVIKDYNFENKTEITKSDIVEEIEKLYTLYQNVDFDQVLYWNESLYSCDFDFKFLMLEKNIMLDASANFNTLYESKMFDVVKSKRIINHNKCYLMWHDVNTSKSAKKRTSDNNQLTNWRKYIVNDIKKKAKKDSEVLIITNKSECDALEERFIDDDFKGHFKNYKFLNFFNMRGINDYAKYNECFIIHTHRFPFPVYILMYMYYIAESDVDIFKLDMTYGKYRGNNSVGFRDKILDGLLFSDEISALYQGCKRICRDKDPKGNFHVYNSNFEVITAIQNELLDVRIIPDEDNKKAKLSEDFFFTLDKIREGTYDDYKVTDGRTKKKVKAVKRGKKNFYEVSKKLFYEVLDIDSKHFKRDIIDKVNEKELNIKFENETVRVYF